MCFLRSLAIGAMVLFCFGAAADAPTVIFKKTTTHPAAETVGQLFDGMREGDAAKVQSAYAPRAWALISAVGSDESGVELPQRLKQRMAAVTSVEAVSSRDEADGKGATIKVKITQPTPEETVSVFLSKDDSGAWKVDYPGEVEAPFCLDDWVGLFLVWDVSYRAAKEINDPRGWYEQVLVGVRRGWALADARPQDVITLYAVGGVYFDQLGFGDHRNISRPAVRKETLGRDRGDVAQQARISHPKLLDDSGKILPEIAAKLPYLAAYPDGFPHGVPPAALAYDFNKRAQVAQTEGRRHLQLAPMLLDSRPALTLKAWGQDEYDLARKLEGDVATAEQAVFAFRRSAHVFGDAADEYERHVKAFPKNQRAYASHLSEVRAAGAAAIADADFLRAMSLRGKERDEVRKAAKENYAKARGAYQAIVAMYPDPADEEDRAEFQAQLDHVTRRLKLLDPP